MEVHVTKPVQIDLITIEEARKLFTASGRQAPQLEDADLVILKATVRAEEKAGFDRFFRQDVHSEAQKAEFPGPQGEHIYLLSPHASITAAMVKNGYLTHEENAGITREIRKRMLGDMPPESPYRQ
jgi:hypothetical protein